MRVWNTRLQIDASNTLSGYPVVGKDAIDICGIQFWKLPCRVNHLVYVRAALVVWYLRSWTAVETNELAATANLLARASFLPISARHKNDLRSRSHKMSPHIEHHQMRAAMPPKAWCFEWVVS